MAQVIHDTQRHIELLLDSVIDLWQNLPRTAFEIASWDLIDQTTFVEEWPLQEQRLATLAAYATNGMLSAEQLKRYRELEQSVAQNRPLAATICRR